MEESTRIYRAHEFADLNPLAGQIRIKITASTDEHTSQTKWLTITHDELDAIKAVLIRKDA
jgi:hypothetical protein